MVRFVRTMLMQVASLMGFAIVFVPTTWLMNWMSDGGLVEALFAPDPRPVLLFVAGFVGAWLGADSQSQE